MRAIAVVVALGLGASAAAPEAPPLTPAGLLLAIDAAHLDAKLLAASLSHSDPAVRATGARLIGVFSVAELSGVVAAALQQEPDPRAGAELARAILFLRGQSAADLVTSAAQRLGGPAAAVVKTWRERATVPAPSLAPNDVMFSRTVDIWVPNLPSQLAAATHCKLEDDARFGLVRLTYRRDGKPTRVEVDKTNLSNQCASVLSALGRTTVAEEGQPVGDGYQQWVVVPFSRDFARCAERLDDGPVMERTPAPQVPPKKIKDVRPLYPREMQAQRASGLVFVEGVVSTTGCLVNLRVIRSTGLPFELEALRAMSGWKFEPARHNGGEVPVRMTLTTNFSIR